MYGACSTITTFSADTYSVCCADWLSVCMCSGSSTPAILLSFLCLLFISKTTEFSPACHSCKSFEFLSTSATYSKASSRIFTTSLSPHTTDPSASAITACDSDAYGIFSINRCAVDAVFAIFGNVIKWQQTTLANPSDALR